jgi:hypothetical protein
MVLFKKLINKENSLQLSLLVVVPYLLINTGIFSDEYCFLLTTQNKNLTELLVPKGYFLIAPIENYTHFIWYHFAKVDNLILVYILKILYVFLSLYFLVKFFALFLNRQNAFLISLLFLFFPSHDSTPYSLLTQYITLTVSFYLYAFYLAYNNKLIWAFVAATVASFISYASVVIAISLFSYFIVNKEFKKSLVIFIPNVIFSIYYIVMSRILDVVKTQIPDKLNIYILIKQFVLQVVTFIDSVVGPSMWLKLYYSYYELSAISFVIGIFLIFIFYITCKENEDNYNSKLIISFIVLLLTSFAAFAITGKYPQLAFNLGNRTTVFGSLLLAYLIVLIPSSRKKKTAIFAIFLFSILGISDHCKNWNIQQQQVIDNIKKNQALRDYKDDKQIFVSGNQYSKFGPISHIEFLSENWVTSGVFNLALKKEISAVTINKRHVYEDGYLIDTKYNTKAEVNDYINVYDSENDRLFTLNVVEINSYIDSLPPENRHWIMLSDNRLISFVKTLVIKLMPRLEYAF